MDNYKELPTIDSIEKSQSNPLRFFERKTMSMITKKICLPEYNFSFHNCEVDFYILNSTTLYTPESTCLIYLCDYCPYSIKIWSDEMEEKEMNGWFVSPKEIELKITPVDQYSDIDVNNLPKFTSIGINLIIPFELCLYNETCPFYNISDRAKNKESALYKHLLDQLYPLNISITTPPNKELYNYSNITFYITYTEEQEREILENALNITLEEYKIVDVELVKVSSDTTKITLNLVEANQRDNKN